MLQPCPTPHAHLGFTLLETLAALAVLGVLAALAAPSFRAMQQRWQVENAVRAMESSLVLARSEAIRTAGKVALIPASARCSTQWGCGWVIFADLNGDGVQSAGESTLQKLEAHGEVHIALDSQATALKLDRYGALVDTNSLAFAFTPVGDAQDAARQMLCVRQGWYLQKIQGTSCK